MLEQVQQVDTRNISQNARKTERERERGTAGADRGLDAS